MVAGGANCCSCGLLGYLGVASYRELEEADLPNLVVRSPSHQFERDAVHCCEILQCFDQHTPLHPCSLV